MPKVNKLQLKLLSLDEDAKLSDYVTNTGAAKRKICHFFSTLLHRYSF